MNERIISELYEKAHIEASVATQMVDMKEYNTLLIYEFAELIVRECMKLVEDGVIDKEVGHERGGVIIHTVGAGEVIAEHFGVDYES